MTAIELSQRERELSQKSLDYTHTILVLYGMLNRKYAVTFQQQIISGFLQFENTIIYHRIYS